MACASDGGTSSYEQERDNFFCLTCLLFNVGNKTLRCFFKNSWPKVNGTGAVWSDTPADGAQFLALSKKVKLSPTERSVIQNGDTNEWDLTLLLKVLMHSQFRSPMPAFVPPSSQEFDWLDEIRKIRNTLIGHAKDTTVPKVVFEPAWKQATMILENFGATKKEIAAVQNDIERTRREAEEHRQRLLEAEEREMKVDERLANIEKILRDLFEEITRTKKQGTVDERLANIEKTQRDVFEEITRMKKQGTVDERLANIEKIQRDVFEEITRMKKQGTAGQKSSEEKVDLQSRTASQTRTPKRNCRIKTQKGGLECSDEEENLCELGMLRVTLLAYEWGSSKGGLSTLNRELAKALASVPGVKVTTLVPQCSEQEKQIAQDHGVNLVMAQDIGTTEFIRLSSPPKDLAIDVVIGHGHQVGPPAQVIANNRECTWVHVVHTASEELAMFKQSEKAISQGEKNQETELDLCKKADLVVAIGPKLAEAWSAYLLPAKKLFEFTPGVFKEFEDLKQREDDLGNFRVLVFGRGDPEYFKLKGYDIAARAIAELKDKTYHLIFVGAPDGEKKGVQNDLLKHGIDRSQLSVRRFQNDREKLSELFYEADLAIMPSRTEGFGLTALEALSAGLPVLVSSNSGFGKALEKLPFGNSYIVTTDDAIDWAKSIKQMRQKNRSVRLAEAKNVRTDYAQKYDWFKQCEELVERLRDMRRSGR